MQEMIDRLLASEEPSIRYKVLVHVLGEKHESKKIQSLQNEIKDSPRVKQLLFNRDDKGRIQPVRQPYKKWIGAHWVFATLADIGYPPGDNDLAPIRDQIYNLWLHPNVIREFYWEKKQRPPRHRDKGVPIVNGRARRCASQQANALFSTVSLGLMDDRCDQLAECLLRWQWPDGGWNCDRKASASKSSFWESLIPLRALALYAKTTGDVNSLKASELAAEMFLKRRLYFRMANGEIMRPQFIRLHYPCYWKYDILFSLKVMAEAGFILDERCDDALDLLEYKRLPDGGWPAEERFYQNSNSSRGGYDLVSWSGVSKKKLNEWITADVLYVLKAAGRLDV